jgi:hypothetical protein
MKTAIEMAREAGFHSPVRADGYMGLAYDRREGRETGGSLKRLVELVRADAIATEREACAKVCDWYVDYSSNPMNFAENCAQEIRARGSNT